MSKEFILVLLGGGIGSVSRYLISEYTPIYYKGNFPLSTFIANIIGCFLIGIFISLSNTNSGINTLLITGFCGGFTTFSTFSKETFQFLKKNQIALALFYIIVSSIFGILAVYAGLHAF